MNKTLIPDLSQFHTRFDRGKSPIVEGLWIVVQALFVSSFIPGSLHRRLLLRLFGARIGTAVVLKPGIRIKFPWRLMVGDHSWIGEDAWIDNLAEVRIGANCCISQGAYLCTGNHDWSSPAFDLITRPIMLEEGAWVGARACVGPGVTVGRAAIVSLGTVATRSLSPGTILSAASTQSERLRSVEAS